ncbi:MAG: DMT family transporter, partial [Pseudomonadota bacterium]
MKLPQIEQTPPTTLTRTANNVPLGIALFVCTTLFFTGLDASAKYMSAELPTAQIVWMRFLSHVVILTIVVLILAPKRALQKPRRPGLQVLRSAVMAMTTVLNFMALKTMQLAETNAIFFTAPMFIAILAGP